MKRTILRPIYEIEIGQNVTIRNASLIFQICSEIERYVINRDFKGFSERKHYDKDRDETFRIFGWNPCFVPNTTENDSLASIVSVSKLLVIRAIQKGKRIIIYLILENPDKEEVFKFQWVYRVSHSSTEPTGLHFEREIKNKKSISK